jgi:Nucleoside 2-deoxyribosyltransferase like
MNVIKPTNKNPCKIFLAGSIEMGAARKWQDVVTDHLSALNVDIYNPRRDDWDSSWTQSIENSQFVNQVNWELTHINRADLVLFYFDPATQSPISLLEFGYCTHKSDQIIVCCPYGFWRKGNIDVMTKRFNIPTANCLGELIDKARTFIEDYDN